MSTKYLYILCNAGLTNRMHAIAGAQRLAEKTGRELRVWWPLNRHLNAPFKRLFTNPLNLLKQFELEHLLETETRVKFYDCGPKEDASSGGYNVERDDPHDIIAIKTWYVPKFRGEGFQDVLPEVLPTVRGFKPVPEVVDMVKEAIKRIDGWCNDGMLFGVHIRYGDVRQYNPNEWDEAIIKRYAASSVFAFNVAIERVLTRFPEAKFFLVSPNVEIENRFRATYLDRVYSPLKSTEGRLGVRGMREALVDLLLLAQTDLILGSDFSQFSKAASELGNVPLVQVGNWCWEHKLDHLLDKL